jgi:hypothetical protein
MSRQDDDLTAGDLMQRDCDCWVEHTVGATTFASCLCSCHAPLLQRMGDVMQPWAMRYVCLACVEQEHSECQGMACECRRCAYDDN